VKPLEWCEHAYAHIHAHTHTRTHAHTHTHTHTHIHTHTHTHTHTRSHAPLGLSAVDRPFAWHILVPDAKSNNRSYPQSPACKIGAHTHIHTHTTCRMCHRSHTHTLTHVDIAHRPACCCCIAVVNMAETCACWDAYKVGPLATSGTT
jgi:hypothetical protein